MANFDESQKKAINIEINSVVSAGAGSGKTTVLSERFSHLVIDKGYKVDEILTLTFTKEATVEMSSRIYKVLREHNSPEAANFYKANIRTIDGYCNAVAKMGAHLYGISPDFQQSDELADQVKAMALPFILEHRDNPAIRALVGTTEFESKASEIFVYPVLNCSTITEPIDFEKTLDLQCREIIKAWSENGKAAVDKIHELISGHNNFDGNRGTKMMQALDAVITELEMPGLHELTKDDIYNSDAKLLLAFIEYIKKLSGVSLTGAPKGTEEIKNAIYDLRNAAATLESISNFVSEFHTTLELVPLIEEFQNRVNTLKRQSGMLNFADISSLALCILRDHPELRQIEKEKYKAIMIDEFQDNNSQQRDLLFLLAERLDRHEKGIPAVEDLEKEKLFFVGDEKQSIYKFRGADVSVFRGLSNDFKNGNLSMATNYRSDPALIAGFNTIFGGYKYPPAAGEKGTVEYNSVFYNEKKQEELEKAKETVPEYEAVYHEVTLPESFQKQENDYSPKIHVALYDKNNEVADNSFLVEKEAEAEWVAQKIQELTESGRYEADEIAILFRDLKYQALYERTLLSHGIPYNTAAVSGFFQDGPVNDIFSFLRLCAYKNDTKAYAQILRGPFANLSIKELNVILSQKAELFAADISLLDSKSAARYENARQAFELVKQTIKEKSIAKAVTMLWYELGYRYETMWNPTVELYGKMYDLVFEKARQADEENISLSCFVDSLKDFEALDSKLEGLNIPLEQVAGVHIMTIHKSKGLEFPVVFLCATQKQSANDTNSDAIYSSRKFGVTVNSPGKSNYFFNTVKELNARMTAAELRRVTYVALTRAKKELYITNGKFSISEKDPYSEKYLPGAESNPRTIYNVLEPVINKYYSPEEGFTAASPFDFEVIAPAPRNSDEKSCGRKNNAETKTMLLQNIESGKEPDPYVNAEFVEKEQLFSTYTTPSKLHRQDDETGIDFEKAEYNRDAPFPEITDIIIRHNKKFDFTNFGTIAHAYMEAAINKTAPNISARDIAGLEDDTKALETVKKTCEKMQKTFIDSDLGKEAINSGWHKAEYEFRSKVSSRIVKGVIDLVYRNEDGTYTIVDYKSNQTMEPEIYCGQLACYRQAIASMLNVQNPETIKCKLYYLRFGKEIDITTKCYQVDLKKIVDSL